MTNNSYLLTINIAQYLVYIYITFFKYILTCSTLITQPFNINIQSVYNMPSSYCFRERFSLIKQREVNVRMKGWNFYNCKSFWYYLILDASVSSKIEKWIKKGRTSIENVLHFWALKSAILPEKSTLLFRPTNEWNCIQVSTLNRFIFYETIYTSYR